MIAIDTNVLVRILVDEPSQPAQVTLARTLASRAGKVYVPIIVLVETVWVLESSYRLPKSSVLNALAHITTNEAFELENLTRCTVAVKRFRESSADFSDCLILAGCLEQNLVLYTFDKSFGSLAGTVLVKPSNQA